MKSRASVCKSGLGDTSSLLPESFPFFDRTVIRDPNHLESIYLNGLAKDEILGQSFHKPCTPTNIVRATFALGQTEILKLKRLVQDQLFYKYNKDIAMGNAPSLHLSTFVLTCSYVWVCLIKVLANEVVDGKERERLAFFMECRERLNPPIPITYFGNCLMPCFVDVNRNDLIGENGMAIAAEAIGNAIQRMVEGGVLRGAEEWVMKSKVIAGGRFLSVAGSPKLAVYDTDFGWGRPTKSEVISIDANGAISLNERKDGEKGIEVGLVLHKLQMDAFASLFTNTLRVIS